MTRVIIFAGPPGSGKSTQAVNVSKEYRLAHFDTGSMYRRLKAEGMAMPEVDKGILADPKTTLELTKKEISKLIAENPEGASVSGALRTIEEAFGDHGDNGVIHWLAQTYGKENLILFRINLSPEESARRNAIRGEGRVDDAPEVMATRLEQYSNRTKPVFDRLKVEGFNVIEIDGMPSREEVFEDIKRHLGPSD
jgi:adenylate kinase